MAYDEGLGERVRSVMQDLHGVSERKMFGGLAFMIRGNMAVGVLGDELMVRVGPEAYDRLAEKPHTRPMDFTGRPMKGFLYVEAGGIEDDHALAHWVGHGVEYALALPAKPGAPPRKGRGRASRR